MNKINKAYSIVGKVEDIAMAIGMLAVIVSGIGVGFRAGVVYTTIEMNKEKENEGKE